MRRSPWPLGLVTGWAAALMLVAPARGDVTVERRDDRVDVLLDGKPFTSYVFKGHAKPILFPVVGPTGKGLTRQWPLVDGVDGEPKDHPHHESLWFTHGNVNGLDFWAHKPAKQPPDGPAARPPRIEQVGIEATGGGAGVIETSNRWCTPDGTVVCTDTRRILFAGDDAVRTIDHSITIRADHGPVTFGDTKEGTLAIRVHPALQPKDVNGSRGASGLILNSEGRRNAEAWGKPARWVDYSGVVDGEAVGIAIFDHPTNHGHPTHWHAREYGLFAANPFGLHDFAGGPPGAGAVTIPAGGSLTLRHLFVLHRGDAAAAGIADRWTSWAAGKP
jgi:hypothetical protein